MTDSKGNLPFSARELVTAQPMSGPVGELVSVEVPEYPFATSPFDEERRPPEIARDQTVTHTTVGGRGIVGRIKP